MSAATVPAGAYLLLTPRPLLPAVVCWGAMFTGQYQIAKLTALELRAQLPLTTTDDYLPMLDFLEMFIAVP